MAYFFKKNFDLIVNFNSLMTFIWNPARMQRGSYWRLHQDLSELYNHRQSFMPRLHVSALPVHFLFLYIGKGKDYRTKSA